MFFWTQSYVGTINNNMKTKPLGCGNKPIACLRRGVRKKKKKVFITHTHNTNKITVSHILLLDITQLDTHTGSDYL